MSKSKDLLKMFVTEGLVDGQMMPKDLPKLDNNIQQNKGSTSVTNKLEVPQPDEANLTSPQKPTLPNELKDKKDGDEKEEFSEYKMALEASHQCLSLAEYHLGKLNKMKELSELEDVNLDKIGAAHKIITDTRQALQEMIKKCEKPKEEGLKESSDLIGVSVFGIGGEEKIADISKGREDGEFYLLSDEEIDNIKKSRLSSSAPLFFQMGGWYYPITKAAKISSQSMRKGYLTIDLSKKIKRKDAFEILKKTRSENPQIKFPQ
jgi:hypothetical protein